MKMIKQTQVIWIPVPKPRNAVFASLRNRLMRSNAAGAHAGTGRDHQRNERDLADRIREIGEW
ncbi:hypothetical protein BH10PSE17_BH10PSE17_10510 [soil metagenome]